jgi:plastocyanin
MARYAKWAGLAIPAACLLAASVPPALSAEALRLALVDAAGTAAPGVVLYLQGSAGESAREGVPHAQIDQRNKAFVPGYIVVQKGTPVDFPNNDSVRHHVYSFAPSNAFEMALYKGVPARPVVFQHAGVVTLGCNIHDQMLGYIVVVETPYFGITAADGMLTLPGVRPGHYTIMAWSPRLGPDAVHEAGSLDVSGAETGPIRVRLAQKLKAVGPATTSSLAWGDY